MYPLSPNTKPIPRLTNFSNMITLFAKPSVTQSLKKHYLKKIKQIVISQSVEELLGNCHFLVSVKVLLSKLKQQLLKLGSHML